MDDDWSPFDDPWVLRRVVLAAEAYVAFLRAFAWVAAGDERGAAARARFRIKLPMIRAALRSATRGDPIQKAHRAAVHAFVEAHWDDAAS